MSSTETTESTEIVCDQCGGGKQGYYMPYMQGDVRNPYFPTGLPLGNPTSPMPFSPETFQQPTTWNQDMNQQGQGMPPMQGMMPQTPGGTLTTPPLFSG